LFLVDSAGRVRAHFADVETGVHVAQIRWLPGLTPYARFGETWLAILALLALVAVTLAARLPPTHRS
jgi:apolipoprotein N-acyltransferase